MADAGFYRGTNSDQDNRFSDKEKKLLKTMKFEDALERKINRDKVNLDVIKPWVSTRITEILGMEDDVVTEYIFSQLEEKELNPKIIQINITGFLNARRSREFMGELWNLLIEAEESEDGIPKTLVEKKLNEMRRRDQPKEAPVKKENLATAVAENDWKHRFSSLSGGRYAGPMIKDEKDDRIYVDEERFRRRSPVRRRSLSPRSKKEEDEREKERDRREKERQKRRDDERKREDDDIERRRREREKRHEERDALERRDRDRRRDRDDDRDRDRNRDRERDRDRRRRERSRSRSPRRKFSEKKKRNRSTSPASVEGNESDSKRQKKKQSRGSGSEDDERRSSKKERKREKRHSDSPPQSD